MQVVPRCAAPSASGCLHQAIARLAAYCPRCHQHGRSLPNDGGRLVPPAVSSLSPSSSPSPSFLPLFSPPLSSPSPLPSPSPSSPTRATRPAASRRRSPLDGRDHTHSAEVQHTAVRHRASRTPRRVAAACPRAICARTTRSGPRSNQTTRRSQSHRRRRATMAACHEVWRCADVSVCPSRCGADACLQSPALAVLARQIDVCPITVSPDGHSRTQIENAAAAHLVYLALRVACSTLESSAVCLYAAITGRNVARENKLGTRVLLSSRRRSPRAVLISSRAAGSRAPHLTIILTTRRRHRPCLSLPPQMTSCARLSMKGKKGNNVPYSNSFAVSMSK